MGGMLYVTDRMVNCMMKRVVYCMVNRVVMVDRMRYAMADDVMKCGAMHGGMKMLGGCVHCGCRVIRCRMTAPRMRLGQRHRRGSSHSDRH